MKDKGLKWWRVASSETSPADILVDKKRNNIFFEYSSRQLSSMDYTSVGIYIIIIILFLLEFIGNFIDLLICIGFGGMGDGLEVA